MDSIFIILIAAHAINSLARPTPSSCPDLPNHVAYLPGLLDRDQICNYAGYSFGSPYFYWFMVKTNYTRLLDVPLLVYIGSGTESSLVRIFQPGGPYRLDQVGPEFRVSVVDSLLDVANVLYVEQPGLFSFSKEKFTGDYTVYVFLNELQRFLDSFVNYNGLIGMGSIYIVAEGYMAKVGAMLATPNSRQQENPRYTIRGLIVNNGIYDLSKHVTSLGSLSAELGIIPEDLLSKMVEETYVTPDMIESDPLEAFRRWELLSDSLQKISGLPNFWENLSDTSPKNRVAIVEDYLSQDNVQSSLHIRQYTVWESHPKLPAFQRALPAILNISTTEFNALINEAVHVDVMFNVGVYSPLTSIDAFQRWVKSTEWGGKEQIFFSNRIFVTDNESMIYVKEKDQVVYAIYPDEGRIIGNYSQNTYISSLTQFIKTHTLKGLVEDDTELAAILNDCNNHGTFNQTTEECECDPKYYGADCSVVLDKMPHTSYSFSLKPTEWKYLLLDLPGTITKYVVEEGSANGCQGKVTMVVGISLDKLPDEDDNDLLSTKNEIVVEKEMAEPGTTEIILGIKNTSPFCEYQVKIIEKSLEGSSADLVENILIGILFSLLCLMLGTFIGCYIMGRSDRQKLNELKV